MCSTNVLSVPTHQHRRLIACAFVAGLAAACATAQAGTDVKTGASVAKILQFVHSGQVSLILNADPTSRFAGSQLVAEVLAFEQRHGGNLQRNGGDNLPLLDRLPPNFHEILSLAKPGASSDPYAAGESRKAIAAALVSAAAAADEANARVAQPGTDSGELSPVSRSISNHRQRQALEQARGELADLVTTLRTLRPENGFVFSEAPQKEASLVIGVTGETLPVPDPPQVNIEREAIRQILENDFPVPPRVIALAHGHEITVVRTSSLETDSGVPIPVQFWGSILRRDAILHGKLWGRAQWVHFFGDLLRAHEEAKVHTVRTHILGQSIEQAIAKGRFFVEAVSALLPMMHYCLRYELFLPNTEARDYVVLSADEQGLPVNRPIHELVP